MLPARKENDLLNLRFEALGVNHDTQYVVDIVAGTHDIAPELLQARIEIVIEKGRGESARAVEILAEIQSFADENQAER